MSKIDELLSRLDKVKPTGRDKWIACCPAHDDKSPSLSISTENNKTLIHCFAGCSPLEVLHAVNMELTDLFEDDKPWAFSDTTAREKHAAKHENHKIWLAQTRLQITTENLKKGHPITPDEIKKAQSAKHYLASVGWFK